MHYFPYVISYILQLYEPKKDELAQSQELVRSGARPGTQAGLHHAQLPWLPLGSSFTPSPYPSHGIVNLSLLLYLAMLVLYPITPSWGYNWYSNGHTGQTGLIRALLSNDIQYHCVGLI